MDSSFQVETDRETKVKVDIRMAYYFLNWKTSMKRVLDIGCHLGEV